MKGLYELVTVKQKEIPESGKLVRPLETGRRYFYSCKSGDLPVRSGKGSRDLITAKDRPQMFCVCFTVCIGVPADPSAGTFLVHKSSRKAGTDACLHACPCML